MNRRRFLSTSLSSAALAGMGQRAVAQENALSEIPKSPQEQYELYLKVADGELNDRDFDLLSQKDKKELADILHNINENNVRHVAFFRLAIFAQTARPQGYAQYYMRDPRYMQGYAQGQYTHQTGYADNERDMGAPINEAIQNTGQRLMDEKILDEYGQIRADRRDELEHITDGVLKINVVSAGENVRVIINRLLSQSLTYRSSPEYDVPGQFNRPANDLPDIFEL